MIKQGKILKIILPIFILVLVLTTQITTYADIANTEKNRIVFVIDASGSMNSNDPDRLVNEIVKMFIDASHSGKTEVGLVVFNDTIVKSYPISPIATEEQRDSLKYAVDNIIIRGSTDIGLALHYAMNMFATTQIKDEARLAVILFSDGETDLRHTRTGRTMEDSIADEQAAFALSKEMNIPIFSVALSRAGPLNIEYLETISEITNGRTYKISTIDNVPPLFRNLFTDVTGTEIITKYVTTGTGTEQNVSITLSNYHLYEANIITWLGSGYQSIKIKGDSFDNITLQKNFTADLGAEVEINVISFYNIPPDLGISRNLGAVIVMGLILTVSIAAYILYTKKPTPPVMPKPSVPKPTPTTSKPIPVINSSSTARFEGYFLNTLTDNEIPILNWSALCISNKKTVSLGEIFTMLEVTEDLPEAHQIFLKGGNDNTAIFHHSTNCIVSIGDRHIEKGIEEILQYDDKIYITFEDGITEIEIRYKRIRKFAAN